MDDAAVFRQNQAPGLLSRLLAALSRAGMDPQRLDAVALAPLDQFHTGGRPATVELLRRAGFTEGMRVLDVGGGLGGAARTVAVVAGCRVTVLDLSADYCQAGHGLSLRCGLAGAVQFVAGDAVHLPFCSASFDGVWTQHSTMNIAAKAGLLTEIGRVLRPGGRLAMHEVVAGPAAALLRFPLPWATAPAAGALVSAEALRDLLLGQGFRLLDWQDSSEAARAAVRALADRLASNPPALGLHLLLDDFADRAANFAAALEQGAVSVIQAVCERPA